MSYTVLRPDMGLEIFFFKNEFKKEMITSKDCSLPA